MWPRLRKYAKQEEISSGLNRIKVPVYDDQGVEVFEFRSITKPSEISCEPGALQRTSALAATWKSEVMARPPTQPASPSW